MCTTNLVLDSLHFFGFPPPVYFCLLQSTLNLFHLKYVSFFNSPSLIREAIPREKCSFFNIVQKAFDPPPLSFEHYVVNFSEEILTKVRKTQSQMFQKVEYG